PVPIPPAATRSSADKRPPNKPTASNGANMVGLWRMSARIAVVLAVPSLFIWGGLSLQTDHSGDRRHTASSGARFNMRDLV
ncbi:MAG: hypothetical protein ACI9OJ_002003, partial [Myxococcota bacterium]